LPGALLLVAADGTGLRRVTNTPGNETTEAWSRDRATEALFIKAGRVRLASSPDVGFCCGSDSPTAAPVIASLWWRLIGLWPQDPFADRR
jgi:hypothetical protein